MLQKNKGFFLPEMLLTLSAWLVIATIFIPLIMNLVDQSVQLRQEFDSTNALYETLLKAQKEGVLPQTQMMTINQTVYEIYEGTSGGNAGQEVCIKYENVFKKLQSKCEIYE
ncbi:type II secretion system protein [Bacillus sp. FJAT-29937]|uniref:type II secretion system protein n=1 Tax=Bacillus sp. FJAT-29937 TaxID=1720553 RepID=UPI00082B5819|nr:type II secretion system protein [Bacillus sp. FJAT-29937]